MGMERALTDPTRAGPLKDVKVPAKFMHKARTECEERESAYMDRIRTAAREKKADCYESLITFLEMNNLSGAYALGLAANGMEDLSQLLLADEAELNRAIDGSSMDAMDEILFREAIHCARGAPMRSPRMLRPVG